MVPLTIGLSAMVYGRINGELIKIKFEFVALILKFIKDPI